MMSERDTLVVPATMDRLAKIIDFIKQAARDYGFDDKMINKIHLVTEEVAANIINYAYPDKTGTIEINYSNQEGRTFTVEFKDTGTPFNPLDVPEPDLGAPIEDRTIGGLGIFLVREIMDDVSYRRDKDQNILTLIKH